jgi:lantibiotic modifying enzyme
MSSDDGFLDAAASIGHQIASDAVWHHGRCNWLGAVAEPAVPGRPEYRALGPSLYGGTAGIGLFLSHLAAMTCEAQVRQTAVGALRHALGHAAPLPSATNFYAGTAGVAWAAATVARLLGEDELGAHARALLDRSTASSDGRLDILTGTAGSVIGLLAVAGALSEPRLVTQALAAGDALIARATVTRNGYSWTSPGKRYAHHLCGMSHGAAGIGWALLELFAATGENRFQTAATAAFAYERSWLDPTTGTWPDLRLAGTRPGEPRAFPSPAVATWCHGEAGIALARLRAVTLLGPGAHRDDAEIALETTRHHLAQALPYDIEDLSLCHGAAGAADALLCAADVLGGRWDAAADVATELGHTALQRHSSHALDWPCGVDGTTPGLFLGLSGIGWFFLRLHHRVTPSPLAPQMRLTSVSEPA